MDEHVDRRSFMVRTITGIFVFIGGVMTAALGGFGILPVLKKRDTAWSDAGTIEDLAVDHPGERRFFEKITSGRGAGKRERFVWLVLRSGGSVTAYSAHCPHLGCGYRWIEARNRFECPCHGSFFDIKGNVLAGPAPRPLDTLETKVENGRLYIRYEVFQLGTTKKVAA